MSISGLITHGLITGSGSGGGSAPIPSATEGYIPFDLVGGYLATDMSSGLAIDASGSITVQVGSTQSVTITCNQLVTSASLLFTVETLSKTDVASVANASIDKDEYEATLSLTSEMTASERTLRWSLTKTSNGETVASGLMFVTYDAQGDS